MVTRDYTDFDKSKVATNLLLLNAPMLNLIFMKHLIDSGADINAQDSQGNTILHIIATDEKKDIVEYALSLNANLKIKNNNNYTAIDLAKENHNYEIVELLRSSLIGPVEEKFLYYVVTNNVERIKVLVELNVNPNIISSKGVTPLHTASLLGHLETVSYLIEAGINLNSLDDDNTSALHYALPGLNLTTNHRKIVYTLLQHGADPTLGKETDFNIIYKLAYLGFNESLNLALKHLSIDINMRLIDYNLTALHASVGNNQITCTHLLLAKGIDLTIKNLYGNTAYQVAENSRFYTLKKLLASLDTRLISAAANNQLDLVQLLLDKGANINAKGYYGEDALQLASEKCHTSMVTFLVENGAEMEKDLLGSNALYRAARKKCYSVVDILVKSFGQQHLYSKNFFGFGYSAFDLIPEYIPNKHTFIGNSADNEEY